MEPLQGPDARAYCRTLYCTQDSCYSHATMAILRITYQER